eukprot:scaffold69365_cov19-Tisochrysis_lutea.AAC.2
MKLIEQTRACYKQWKVGKAKGDGLKETEPTAGMFVDTRACWETLQRHNVAARAKSTMGIGQWLDPSAPDGRGAPRNTRTHTTNLLLASACSLLCPPRRGWKRAGASGNGWVHTPSKIGQATCSTCRVWPNAWVLLITHAWSEALVSFVGHASTAWSASRVWLTPELSLAWKHGPRHLRVFLRVKTHVLRGTAGSSQQSYSEHENKASTSWTGDLGCGAGRIGLGCVSGVALAGSGVGGFECFKGDLGRLGLQTKPDLQSSK